MRLRRAVRLTLFAGHLTPDACALSGTATLTAERYFRTTHPTHAVKWTPTRRRLSPVIGMASVHSAWPLLEKTTALQCTTTSRSSTTKISRVRTTRSSVTSSSTLLTPLCLPPLAKTQRSSSTMERSLKNQSRRWGVRRKGTKVRLSTPWYGLPMENSLQLVHPTRQSRFGIWRQRKLLSPSTRKQANPTPTSIFKLDLCGSRKPFSPSLSTEV
mmetsp:Transcript_5900/g.9049  ORF Transcript_5900/g.9049 Transcript_5900/m.9049 type:complete len:214 (-) Transcript_5900:1112-1753(-)